MNYTDEQLKAALAKMLPNRLGINNEILVWSSCCQFEHEVLDTELLHLCWLVEKDLNQEKKLDYIEILGRGEDEESFYPTIALVSDWRRRVAALAKVKGIEI